MHIILKMTEVVKLSHQITLGFSFILGKMVFTTEVIVSVH